MLQLIDIETLEKQSERLQQEFSSNAPFPHVLLDSLLSADTLNSLSDAFPTDSWPHWSNRLEGEHISRVYACEAIEKIPEPIDRLILELSSAPFLRFLSKITGITNLLPDPNLHGGGLHMVAPGGYLTPHTDFHIKENAPRYRQLNLIIYLNRDWQEDNGGQFELWDRKGDRVEKKVPPELGTCFLFKTDINSLHGYSQPVKNRLRRSIALFYYTAEEASDEYTGDIETYWRVQTLKPQNFREWLRLKQQQFHFDLAKTASRIAFNSQMRARSLIAWENKILNRIHRDRLMASKGKK